MSSSKADQEMEKEVYSEILCGWQFLAIQICAGDTVVYFDLFSEASDRSSEPPTIFSWRR
jgi:hypothetical protein